MNEYTLEVTEVLQRQIKIKADNEKDAKRILLEEYKRTDIILDETDYAYTKAEVIEKICNN